MKPFLLITMLTLAGGLSAPAGTALIYVNDAPVQSPPDFLAPIDATSFVNRNLFSIGSSNLIFIGTTIPTLPFETANTLNYTNTSTGVLLGTPGFRFVFTTNGFRYPAARIVNQGSISVDSYLFLRATNLLSTGPIDCGSVGLVHLEGDDVTIRRSGIRAAPDLSGFQSFGGFNLGSNYVNDAGIFDQYWGAGDNNHLDNQGRPMPLGSSFGGQTFTPFDLPFPQSPLHQVASSFGGGQLFTNLTSVPQFFLFGTNFFTPNQFGAFVFTNRTGPTSIVIQVAFVPTNFMDTNFSVDVSFQPDADDGATVQVEFRQADFDIVTQNFFTNFLVFSDTLAFGSNFLARNVDNTLRPTGTRRPSNYDLTRSPLFNFFGFSNSPPNAPFSPDLIFNSTYRSNTVPVRYSAYSAFITPPGRVNQLVTSAAANDPTNFPGRVEILGKKLDLNQARLRAENTLIIKSSDLSSNGVGRVDAPFLIYDLATTQPQLVITNFVPTAVRRLNGQIAAWSAIWTNFADRVVIDPNSGLITTNLESIQTHVLILDAQFQSLQPVDLFQFAAHATNIVIADTLSIGQTLLLDALGVHVTGGITLPLFGSWASSNILRVINFTNDGVVNITGSAKFGSDRFAGVNQTPVPYDNFVNRGSFSAAATFIRTTNFVAAESLSQAGVGSSIFSSGIFQLDAATGRMTNSILVAGGDAQITARDLMIQDTFISAGSNSPGALIVTATNTLTDGGTNAGNQWFVTSGFQFLTRPAGPGRNDLLGSTIQSSAGQFLDVAHVWPAENRGADARGFSNNLALGRLILDGGPFSQFTFDGVGTNDALYVDFLELRNNATNYDTVLQVNPGLTIYFANANIPPAKLDGRQGGRLRWVSNFTGPNSSTNITYPSGITYTFNTALVQDHDLDSDGDGIVNSDDPTPIFVPGDIGLRILSRAGLGGGVRVSWNALADVVNHLEFRDEMADAWHTLTNFLVSPFTQRVTVQDVAPTNHHMRIYRIRMDEQ